MREWRYWTRNKLEILDEYMPAFNRAATKSSHRVYIDLMAGEPFNRDKDSGEEFDGSARLALQSSPGFTKLAFCEMEPKASRLRADLEQRFPGRDFRVYPGDCNVSIDQVLRDLTQYRWAPTFAFVDQQAAEVAWSTLAKLANFKTEGRTKVELWLLASPTMIAKGVAGTNGVQFEGRVDRLYGNRDWRRIQVARRNEIISAETYRDEMVNLLRWQLENEFGYAQTVRIPMNMPMGFPIYDMVFATDHPVGHKIMNHLYSKAADREPEMIAEAKATAARLRESRSGKIALFDLDIPLQGSVLPKWQPEDSWDPRTRTWW